MAEIKLKIASVVIGSSEGGGGGVAPYYADLPDKPSINGETLSGDMSSEDLGLASSEQSVPSGGTTGQVLTKRSNLPNDVEWAPSSGIIGANANNLDAGSDATASIDENHILQLGIPRGADAVNPFKGWFNAVVTGEAGSRVITSETQNLPENPVVGDYAYVKTWDISGTAPSQTETPIAKIYECATANYWSDSGRTADTSNVQTFASNQEVNEVHIVNDSTTGGANDVLSAEQGKELANLISEENIIQVPVTIHTKLVDNVETNGYWSAISGVFVPDTIIQRRATDKIDVLPGEIYFVTTGISGSSGTIAALPQWFFDGNTETFIGNNSNFASGTGDAVDRIYVVPQGVNRIAITSKNSTPPSLKKVDGRTLKFYTKTESDTRYYSKTEINSSFYNKTDSDSRYVQKTDVVDSLDSTETQKPLSAKQGKVLKESIDENNNIQSTEPLPSYTTISGEYVSKNQTIGELLSTSSMSNTLHFTFNIPAGAQVHIKMKDGGSGGGYGFAITDENDLVIEWCRNAATGLGDSEYTFKKYNYATKLHASGTKLILDGSYLIVTESVKDVVTDLREQIEVVEKTNYWQGKRIWWCGTSIPAGGSAGRYPQLIGEMLGATVINTAVGSSMCRANVRTNNYVGANFSNITSALSMTNAEVESFITNYATIKEVLTGNPPASLSEANLTRLRGASFENKLLPYLDGTYDMPDLFVFDHGHNDFKYKMQDGTTSDITLEPTVANIGDGVNQPLVADTYMIDNNNANLESFFGSLTDIPTNRLASFIASVNRNCYIGAVNFLVTLILKYNPKARIVFISNYEYEHGDNPSFAPLIDAQKSISNSWAFPICEVYKYLGFCNHIIPSSKDWFNTEYPSATPVTKDITVFKAYCPDDVHPHSDSTGDAIRIYAGIIAEFLKGCR